jgi:hypothetical protein
MLQVLYTQADDDNTASSRAAHMLLLLPAPPQPAAPQPMLSITDAAAACREVSCKARHCCVAGTVALLYLVDDTRLHHCAHVAPHCLVLSLCVAHIDLQDCVSETLMNSKSTTAAGMLSCLKMKTGPAAAAAAAALLLEYRRWPLQPSQSYVKYQAPHVGICQHAAWQQCRVDVAQQSRGHH